jgi:predicted PolB exonuclease-like 3'-5' exonuclease
LADRVLVLDIETLPDLDAGRALLGAEVPDDALRAALGARYARDGQDPATAFLKPPLHRLAVLGVLRAERDAPDEPFRVTQCTARGTEEFDEATLLARLDALLAHGPLLVGFNTSGFDVPVLRYRALATGVAMPNLLGLGGRQYTHRYSAAHVDLCDRLSGYRASPPPSLAEACALLGIPAKGGMTGLEVEPAITAGRMAEVAAYCETDVAATWLLWLRWMQATGAMPAEAARDSMAAFAAWVEQDGRAHLAPMGAAAARLAL